MLYYVQRPVMLREMVRRGVWHLRNSEAEGARERREAEGWCRPRAGEVGSFLACLEKGSHAELRTLREKFPREMREAGRRATECPVRMGGAGNSDLLYALCEALQAVSVVETGVAYGWSTLGILLSLRERPQARLFSVDLPYLRLRNDAWIGVVVPPELRERWELFKMPDRQGLPLAIEAGRPLDLAHYDSDKRSEARLWAYPLLWDALRSGAVLVSDDVGDNLAFRDFSARVGVEPFIIADGDGGKFQGLLRKP